MDWRVGSVLKRGQAALAEDPGSDASTHVMAAPGTLSPSYVLFQHCTHVANPHLTLAAWTPLCRSSWS